jgi:cytidine deaminase
MDTKYARLVQTLIDKRKAHYNASGYTSLTNSNHMCAILKDGQPISYGTNVYAVNDINTEHAEAQALRKLYERIGKCINAKRIQIDILIIRTNGGNSKPCARCINTMMKYTRIFSIQYIYYTLPDEPDGIRRVKFSKLINEDRHECSFDRNLRRNTLRRPQKTTKV